MSDNGGPAQQQLGSNQRGRFPHNDRVSYVWNSLHVMKACVDVFE